MRKPLAPMSDLELEAVNLVSGSPGAVLLRHDFAERLDASPSQITRVIRKLTDDGMLVRIGIGMYAKARRSKLSGKVIPVLSLSELARKGLTLAAGADWAYHWRHEEGQSSHRLRQHLRTV